MKKLAALVAVIVLMETTVTAQEPPQLYTRPALPSAEALDRLNLKLAWRANVPTQGKRDGFFSIQVLDDQILVQTRSGTVSAIRAEDGTTQWSVPLGVPYRVTHLLGRNNSSVLAVSGTQLYALDRNTGIPQWEFSLPAALSAPPVADNELLYFCFGNGRLSAFVLPKTGPSPGKAGGTDKKPDKGALPPSPPANPILPGSGPPAYPEATPNLPVGELAARGPQPIFLWEFQSETRVDQAPLATQDRLLWAGVDGTFFATPKSEARVQYSFKAFAPLAAPPGQFQDIAYVAAQDYNVYALDIRAGKILWRFTGAAAIFRKPEVNDQDIYVAPHRSGLFRIDRLTGETLWRQPKAERFLSANKKFVYAVDSSGRLLILDRKYGTRLTTFDTRDFVVPISNEQTDRLFLGSHDGLLICLHDRDYVKPLAMKKETAEPPTPGDKTKEGKKPEKPAQPEEKNPEKPEPEPKPKDKPLDKD